MQRAGGGGRKVAPSQSVLEDLPRGFCNAFLWRRDKGAFVGNARRGRRRRRSASLLFSRQVPSLKQEEPPGFFFVAQGKIDLFHLTAARLYDPTALFVATSLC